MPLFMKNGKLLVNGTGSNLALRGCCCKAEDCGLIDVEWSAGIYPLSALSFSGTCFVGQQAYINFTDSDSVLHSTNQFTSGDCEEASASYTNSNTPWTTTCQSPSGPISFTNNYVDLLRGTIGCRTTVPGSGSMMWRFPRPSTTADSQRWADMYVIFNVSANAKVLGRLYTNSESSNPPVFVKCQNRSELRKTIQLVDSSSVFYFDFQIQKVSS